MDRERDKGTYWQETAEFCYLLRIAGAQRAVAYPRNGTVITLPAGNEFYVPESRVIFDEVERLLGIERVEEFRSAKREIRQNSSVRAMAEQRSKMGSTNVAGVPVVCRPLQLVPTAVVPPDRSRNVRNE
jgi:hypothetical protein